MGRSQPGHGWLNNRQGYFPRRRGSLTIQPENSQSLADCANPAHAVGIVTAGWVAVRDRLPPGRGVRADSVAIHQVISYLAALLAAVTNATSNALNRKAKREAPSRARFRLQPSSDLPHRRAWLAAISPAGPREPRNRPANAAGRR